MAGDHTVEFEDTTAREALDKLLELSPEFRWRLVDGIAVVRPIQAWTDPWNPLNQALKSFEVKSHPELVVAEALSAAHPSLLVPQGNLYDKPLSHHLVTVQFAGGTVVDALNRTVSEFDGMWQVGYTGKFFHAVLHTFEFEERVGTVTGLLPNRPR